jgi:hypothetical protein
MLNPLPQPLYTPSPREACNEETELAVLSNENRGDVLFQMLSLGLFFSSHMLPR